MTTDYFGDDYEPPKVWTLAEIYKDLICTAEVGPLLNVRVQRVYLWIRKRHINKCPTPIRTWGTFHLYSASDWRAWYAVFLKRNEKILAHQYIAPYRKPDEEGKSFFTYQDETLNDY